MIVVRESVSRMFGSLFARRRAISPTTNRQNWAGWWSRSNQRIFLQSTAFYILWCFSATVHDRNRIHAYHLDSNPPVVPMENPFDEDILEFRKTLPIWSSAYGIAYYVHRHSVTIVSGETGSGKTTQVSRFISVM